MQEMGKYDKKDCNSLYKKGITVKNWLRESKNF